MDIKTDIKTCKYKRDELSCDSDEHNFVKNFYETNILAQGSAPNNRQVVSPDNIKVYKISENYPTATSDAKRNNLMLFHGTKETNVDGILNKGFINSERGSFGQGVYMTESSSTASDYSLTKTFIETYRITCNRYIFVNEVLESEKLQIVKYKPFEHMYLVNSTPDNKFEKYVTNDNKIASDDYKKDVQGRRYRNITKSYLYTDKFAPDIFLADESLVIPRYLIVIGSDESVGLN